MCWLRDGGAAGEDSCVRYGGVRTKKTTVGHLVLSLASMKVMSGYRVTGWHTLCGKKRMRRMPSSHTQVCRRGSLKGVSALTASSVIQREWRDVPFQHRDAHDVKMYPRLYIHALTDMACNYVCWVEEFVLYDDN